jgi:hypothetical protein
MNLQLHQEEPEPLHAVTGQTDRSSAPTTSFSGKPLDAEVVEALRVEETRLAQLWQEEGTPDATQLLTPEEHEAFLVRLEQQARTQRRQHRMLMSIYSVGIGVYLLSSQGYWLGLPHLSPVLSLPFVLAYSFAIFRARVVGERWKTTAAELAKSNDKRYIGPLIEAMATLDVNIRQGTAREAVISLLPQLKAGDAGLLNAEQRGILHRILGGMPVFNRRDAISLDVAILKAYEQVGDGSALPLVERLANGERAGCYRQVREAAQACLPFLQMRAAQERASHELLRAADGNLTSEAVLLRPASGAIETDTQELLRASEDGST